METSKAKLNHHVLRRRRILIIVAVLSAVAISLALLLVLRSLDLRRIEEKQVDENTELIKKLQRTSKVLCNRGYVIIDLINGSLALVGQRLEQNVKRGDNAAVRADQEFLKIFLSHRERLILELTNPESPCAT